MHSFLHNFYLFDNGDAFVLKIERSREFFSFRRKWVRLSSGENVLSAATGGETGAVFEFRVILEEDPKDYHHFVIQRNGTSGKATEYVFSDGDDRERKLKCGVVARERAAKFWLRFL